ncbi:hypothetical protein [Novosphingobium sp. KN65.2]|uniref:LexA family protein n=1 Tax=Novosphingobium sp. KN65.2 TaxID=1478134 RepID=UPI0005E29E48|nr:hypothetical protein [Novosphingobium sp. KN65.2]CDO34064.1 hypothetical protein SPHV1_100098 [Novosphingobium sp. KN65.2]
MICPVHNSKLTVAQTKVLRVLEQAADAGRPCPTNMEICDRVGIDDVTPMIRALARKGHIMIESGHMWRIVTLVASGRELVSTSAAKRGRR